MFSAATDSRPQVSLYALLFRRVGDSLLATPALRALKKTFPQKELRVVCEPHVARVFQANPWIDECVVVPNGPSAFGLAKVLRHHGRPDVVVDFLSDPRSALACLLSGAPKRAGIPGGFRRHLYSVHIAPQNADDPVYSATHKLALAEAVGAEPDGLRTEFQLAEDDLVFARQSWQVRGWSEQTAVVAFFVHSRRDYKRWPLARFAEVIRTLRNRGLEPLVLVTPGDEAAAETLLQDYAIPAACFLTISDLGYVGAVLQKCRLLIGNDGGPKHLAVALDVPTLTVFGHECAAFWTPPNSPQHVALAAQTQGDTAEWPTTEQVTETADFMLRKSST